MKIRTTLIMLAFLAASPLFGGCSDGPETNKTSIERRPITGVKVGKASGVVVDDFIEASGTIKAKTVSAISSKAMGMVTSINFTEGEYVKSGKVLLTIESADISEKVSGAEAGQKEAAKALEAAKENLNLREATLERYRKLYEGKAVSKHEFETIETAAKTAQLEYERMKEGVTRAGAGVAEARAYKGYTVIKAPYSGVVTEKKIEVGAMASPGTPLLTIEDTSSFTLEAYADERLFGTIRPGARIDALMEATKRTLSATVYEVSGSVNPLTRTFLIKAALKDRDLSSGLYATIRLPAGKKSVITVPASSVVKKGQLTGVYAVDKDSVVTYRLVRTGRAIGPDVEIISGLDQDEPVITEGAAGAFDGGIVGRGE